MDDFALFCNGRRYSCSREAVARHAKAVADAGMAQSFSLECEEPTFCAELVNLYSGGEMDIVKKNYRFMMSAGEQLGDQNVVDGVERFVRLLDEYESVFNESKEMKELNFVENLVYELTEKNIDDTQKRYLASLLYVTKSHICTLLNSVFGACVSDPEKIPIYVDLLSSLIEYEEESNKIGDLIASFLDIICGFYNKKKHLAEINYILFNLSVRNLIKKKDVCNGDVEKMVMCFDNNFNNLSKFTEFDCISSIIKDDDVEKLKYNIDNGIISINSTIGNSFLYPSSLIKNPKLIQLSAFFGSIKCFDFLNQMNAEIEETIIPFAIFGGNIDIIKIIKEMFDLKPYLKIASIYHRNKIFYEIYYPDQICLKQFYSIASNCIRYGNYELFEYVVKEGININGFEDSGLILYNAIKYNNLLISKILLSISYINVNIIVKDNSYLYYAVLNENIEIIKALLSKKDIKINIRNRKGVCFYFL